MWGRFKGLFGWLPTGPRTRLGKCVQRLGASLNTMSADELFDVEVRQRREIDAIRSFYPLYRTPGNRRRH